MVTCKQRPSCQHRGDGITAACKSLLELVASGLERTHLNGQATRLEIKGKRVCMT